MIFSCVVTATTIISLVLPKQYTAETTVILDVKAPDPVTGLLSQGSILPSYLATQVDIINSERVARRVVKLLGFDVQPARVSEWKAKARGDGTLEGYYAAKLVKHLNVQPSRESTVITIYFTDADAKLSADIANAFAKAYLDISVELAVEPARQYSKWFAEQARIRRAKLEKAQEVLSAYQKNTGIVSVDERLSVENTRLNDLSAQLTLMEAQKNDALSHAHASKNDIENNPDAMNSPVIQNLRMSIGAAEGKLQLASKELGVNHPQIKQQKAELNELKSRLHHEMSNVAVSLAASARISEQKESEIRAAFEAQKQLLLDLKVPRDDVVVMQKEVESTQLDYNNIQQRLNESNLQSQSQQSRVSVLSRAFEPAKSSKPKVLINIILSVFIGGLLSILAGLIAEMQDRLVRSKDDLVELGIPVLGVLTAVRVPVRYWEFGHFLKSRP